MSWLEGLRVDYDDYGSEEFQRRECECADCRSGGAFSYARGYVPDDCIYKRRSRV
jgi:hypothetical protein